MIRQVQAVYEGGRLRPLEPLALTEHQHVIVTIEDVPKEPAELWIDCDYHAALDASVEREPTLEEVRGALSSISGSLSDAIRAERDDRG